MRLAIAGAIRGSPRATANTASISSAGGMSLVM
jgi:hypothetical protein